MNRSTLKTSVWLAIIGAIALGVWSQRTSFESLTRVDASAVAAAATVCLIYRLVNSLGWWGVLRCLGARTGLLASARVWLISEASRWLPGSVWNLVSRTAMAGSIGVAPTLAAASVTLELLLTIIAWAVAASLLLPYSDALWQLSWIPKSPGVWMAYLLGLTATLALVIKLTPGVARRLSSKANGFLNGLSSIRTAQPRPLIAFKVVAFYSCLCLLHGFGLWLLVGALTPTNTPPVAAVVGANALAWLVGFFAVFSPGGLMVREGVIALALSPWISPVEAALAAAAWRAIQIAVEIICLGACVAFGSMLRRKEALPNLEPSLLPGST